MQQFLDLIFWKTGKEGAIGKYSSGAGTKDLINKFEDRLRSQKSKIVTVFESKPVCSIHHQSIEQIKHGIAQWSCPKKGCKSKEIGYSNKLISEIWMSFWDDETEVQNFQRSIGFMKCSLVRHRKY